MNLKLDTRPDGDISESLKTALCKLAVIFNV